MILEDLIAVVEKDIKEALNKESSLMKDMRAIHYRMLLMIGINKSIKRLCTYEEKKQHKSDVYIDLWKKLNSKTEGILQLALEKSEKNPVISEYIICPVLVYWKEVTAGFGLKGTEISVPTAPPTSQKIPKEKIEEEKREESDEEEEEKYSDEEAEDRERDEDELSPEEEQELPEVDNMDMTVFGR